MAALYLFKLSLVQRLIGRFQTVKDLEHIVDFLLPIFCDGMFLPVIQIFLEIFICIEEVNGHDLNDSFLYMD
jgi:hypothetical protein